MCVIGLCIIVAFVKFTFQKLIFVSIPTSLVRIK